jgi:hypothetical protein
MNELIFLSLSGDTLSSLLWAAKLAKVNYIAPQSKFSLQTVSNYHLKAV